MPLEGYSVGAGKKTPQHISTYILNMTCNRGGGVSQRLGDLSPASGGQKVTSTDKQPAGPAAITAPVTDPVRSHWGDEAGVGWGRG